MDELKDKLVTIEGLKHFKDKYVPSTQANQIQADWDQTDYTKVDYIKNKPNVVNGNGDASVISKLNKEYISGGVVLKNVSNGDANNGFGIGLKIEGKRNFLAGYKLEANGNINTLLGNELKVFGNYNKILGRSISIGSAEKLLDDFVVFGLNNIIKDGYGNTIFGQSHEIDGGRINTIFGSDNTIKGDLTRAFISGIYNYINILSGGTTDGLFISGRGLKVDDQSKDSYYNGLTILGEYNYCPSNYAKDKVLIIGNGTSDENRRNALEVFRNGTIKAYDETTGGMVELGGLSEDEVNQLITNATTNFVKDTDYATKNVAGLVRVNGTTTSGGLTMSVDQPDLLVLYGASLGSIDDATSNSLPISPAHIDYAVRRCLINPKNITWTPDEQDKARETLGITSGNGNSNIEVDDNLSEESENPVQNKIITLKLKELEQDIENIENIEVDSYLSEESENPVQNKVLNDALNSKLSKLEHSEERNYLYGQDKNGQTFIPLCRDDEILTGAVPKYGADGFIPVGENPVSPRAAVPRSYIDSLTLTGGAKMMKVDSSKIQFLSEAKRFDVVGTDELFDKKSMVTNFKASIQKPQKITTNVFNQLANSVIDQIDLYDLPEVGNDKKYLDVILAEPGTSLYAALQELISKSSSTSSFRCYFGESQDAIGVAIKINWSISNSNFNNSSGSYTIYIELDSLIEVGDVIQAKYSLEIPELQGATRPTYPEGTNILECSLAGVYNYNSDLTLTNASNTYVQLEGSANEPGVEPTYRQYLLTVGKTKSLVNNLTYTQKIYEGIREQLNFNFVLDDFTERIIYCMSATSDGPVIFTIQLFNDYFGINCSDESVFTNGEELAEINLYYQIYY